MVALENVETNLIVKNTFLGIQRTLGSATRRSSSAPGTLRPEGRGLSMTVIKPDAWLHSDCSTSASDKDIMESFHSIPSDSEQESFCSVPADIDQDSHDCCSDCTDDECDFDYACRPCLMGANFGDHPVSSVAVQPSLLEADGLDKNGAKVTLTLDEMVTAESEKVRTKLRLQAQPFKSARTPSAEIESLIAKAAVVISAGADIADVQVQSGCMGGTTIVVAQSSSLEPDPSLVFSLAKDALLHLAEQSESTYILGYGAKPFNHLDALSFSTNIVCVPAAHQDSACWHMYENGHCPRRSSCCWDHPSDMDTMRVIFMIKRAGPEPESLLQ